MSVSRVVVSLTDRRKVYDIHEEGWTPRTSTDLIEKDKKGLEVRSLKMRRDPE